MTSKTSNSKDPVSNSPSGRIGRPPMVLAPSLLESICLRTFEGESMRSIARDPDMPSRERIHKELVENAGFAVQYARAREGLYQAWAEEILEIADDGTTDYVTRIGRNGHEYEAVDQEHIQRSRLRVDSRKWLLSKLLPKTFGDRVEHEHGGEVSHRVDITGLSEREKMRRFALFMLEDQAAGVTIEGHAMPATMPASPAQPTPKVSQPATGPVVEPNPATATSPMDKE